MTIVERATPNEALVRALAEELGGEAGLQRTGRGEGRPQFDIVGPGWAIEVKTSLKGKRDLDAAILQLAEFGRAAPDLDKLILVARLPRMNSEGAEKYWQKALEVLHPDLRRRLRFVAMASDGEVSWPPRDEELARLTSVVREVLRRGASQGPQSAGRTSWTPKSFDVWMVLVDAWLRVEGALAIREIAERSGASYPTVRESLERLQERDELHREKNRAARLSSLPRRSLGEIVVLSASLREKQRFVDRSGRTPDTAALLRRLRSLAPPGVALGGVEAARYHMSELDLLGTPRIDVTVHGPGSLGWLERLDPALGEAGPEDASAVFVVHRANRADPGFDAVAKEPVPYASPADTLLDLYDLRLTTQADEFVNALRRKGEGGGRGR